MLKPTKVQATPTAPKFIDYSYAEIAKRPGIYERVNSGTGAYYVSTVHGEEVIIVSNGELYKASPSVFRDCELFRFTEYHGKLTITLEN